LDESALSVELFRLARDDSAVRLLSWQGVDGKGYFAADVRFKLPSGLRLEPDLIALSGQTVWLLELKVLHSESIADELKLELLRTELGDEQILAQLRTRTGVSLSDCAILLGIVYVEDDAPYADKCVAEVIHIHWTREAAQIATRTGFGGFLSSLIRKE